MIILFSLSVTNYTVLYMLKEKCRGIVKQRNLRRFFSIFISYEKI